MTMPNPPALAGHYRVRVTKDHLVFAAGHFITYNGDHCERIHGHNYRVAVEVEGPLDDNHYVFDFIALLELSRSIVAEWDHRMLLPDGSGLIAVHDDPGEGPAHVRVCYKERRWVFPKEECVILPIPNTTTELLARLFGQRLWERMGQQGLKPPSVLRVEVEENFGQMAAAEWRNPSE
ncbi:6-pyruvoyl tetrahydropterin synthase and hypothetical protein [Isosphaera pallida ATCC 43644]|uniref:6-carboxy-5,6,7,8-tetrahydropterin synthase n=1 Tax=Isosphaera pallida (strain ATCC 43644 / DSM 9630 / IS1B) TaxID=575540 RepID=E8QZT4_ISOPI|nr:6-pyruvoyl tetrahydropterin synthase and hypothetical protein [Isosphaera pallida ATCC 43644]